MYSRPDKSVTDKVSAETLSVTEEAPGGNRSKQPEEAAARLDLALFNPAICGLKGMGWSLTSIRNRLLADRKSLLDLGTRNRLINIPLRTKNVRAIEIVGEKTAEVFRMLGEGKRYTFLPTEQDEAENGGAGDPKALRQPRELETQARQADRRLQTRLSPEALQKRLLDIWYDARTLEEEQGVNILYLALGLLKWFEDDKSEVERVAPLVLLPVRLERTSASC